MPLRLSAPWKLFFCVVSNVVLCEIETSYTREELSHIGKIHEAPVTLGPPTAQHQQI